MSGFECSVVMVKKILPQANALTLNNKYYMHGNVNGINNNIEEDVYSHDSYYSCSRERERETVSYTSYVFNATTRLSWDELV